MGVDPGYAITGYGVIERAGTRLRAVDLGAVTTPGDLAPAQRLASLRESLIELIERHEPGVMAIERVFFNANVQTAMRVGQASGVAIAAGAEHGLEVFEYTPTEVKQSVAGVGNAPKMQVQGMVAALLGLSSPPRPSDAADACALAICHLSGLGLRSALARAGAGRGGPGRQGAGRGAARRRAGGPA